MAQAKKEKSKELFKFDETFSGYSVDDIKSAKEFYGETLGINVKEEKEGGLGLTFGDHAVYLYPKDDHQPATFTVLNIAVTDIDAAVAELRSRGVEFESYGGEIETDEKGIFRGADQDSGPNIAWFKDPAGNILSVIESK